MSKKHIIVCVTNDLIYDQRMQRICTTLAHTHQVTFVGRRKADTPNEVKFDGYQAKHLSCLFSKGKLFYLEYQIRLFFFLIVRRWDAVYAVDLDSLWGAFSAAVLLGRKRIFDAHEYFDQLPEVIDRPLTKWVWKQTAKWWIPQSHLCLTVNEPLAAIFKEEYKTDFHSIRNMPLSKARYTVNQSSAQGKRVLLYQGVLNVGRGLEVMINLMPALSDFELWLVGEGDLSSTLRNQANKSEAASNIKFLGYKSPQELAAITPQAYLGINILEGRSGNYYYSLANKFFDYVQAGVPQISMNFPAYQPFLEEYKIGLLIDDIQPATILNAIQVLSEEPFYQKAVKACHEAANVWVWEEEAPKIQQLVHNLWEA